MSIANNATRVASIVAGGVSVSVLDVGHGNCTIVTDEDSTLVVDAGPGNHVLEFLLQSGISEIDTVLLSHADNDHIHGLVGILAAQIKVRRVLLNTDSSKKSRSWISLIFELDRLKLRGTIVEVRPISHGESVSDSMPRVEAIVVAPRVSLQLAGPGTIDQSGARVTSNSSSAVVRVSIDSKPVILLPGDLDAVGYRHLLDSAMEIKADYLVLPHHGGLSGSPSQTTAYITDFIAVVEPLEVIVSNSRGGVNNPRADVIEAVLSSPHRPHIACTQLSEFCMPDTTSLKITSLGEASYSAGSARNQCCAGTITLTSGNGIGTLRDTTVHDAFVDQFATTALCRRGVPQRISGLPAT